MKSFILLCLLAIQVVNVRACECEDADLGCFDRDGIFAVLWEPYCLSAVKAVYGLYTTDTGDLPVYLTRTDPLPAIFDPSKRTMILVHGFLNDFDTEWLHNVRRALLEEEDCNVIVVGWGGGAIPIVWGVIRVDYYVYSASTTRLVGAELALIIDRLKNEMGLAVSNVWCIGHSLGAQVCGYAGAKTHIGRITGLDPAHPEFTGENVALRLDASDADFVDVIHTNTIWGWLVPTYPYGTPKPAGHADYYPNGMATQPHCDTKRRRSLQHMSDAADERSDMALQKRGDTCSHSLAHKYFLESIKKPGCFNVHQRCTPDAELKPVNCVACAAGECGEMGFRADQLVNGQHVSGMFKMTTTATAPFCKY